MSEERERKDSDRREGQGGGTISTMKGRRPDVEADPPVPARRKAGSIASRKRRAGRGSPSSEMELSSHVGHVLLFQDDLTGRKRINVSALRFVLGIVEDETAPTIRSAAVELMGRNEKVSMIYSCL